MYVYLINASFNLCSHMGKEFEVYSWKYFEILVNAKVRYVTAKGYPYIIRKLIYLFNNWLFVCSFTSFTFLPLQPYCMYINVLLLFMYFIYHVCWVKYWTDQFNYSVCLQLRTISSLFSRSKMPFRKEWTRLKTLTDSKNNCNFFPFVFVNVLIQKSTNNIYPFVDLVQSICEFLREFFFFNILVYLQFQVL